MKCTLISLPAPKASFFPYPNYEYHHQTRRLSYFMFIIFTTNSLQHNLTTCNLKFNFNCDDCQRIWLWKCIYQGICCWPQPYCDSLKVDFNIWQVHESFVLLLLVTKGVRNKSQVAADSPQVCVRFVSYMSKYLLKVLARLWGCFHWR